jgi:Ribbon-helix-helix protein, copG family
MERVQLQLTRDQVAALRRRADETGRSIAALVREAVQSWIAEDQRQGRVARALGVVGRFDSGLGDVAENHDAYLDEAYRE